MPCLQNENGRRERLTLQKQRPSLDPAFPDFLSPTWVTIHQEGPRAGFGKLPCLPGRVCASLRYSAGLAFGDRRVPWGGRFFPGKLSILARVQGLTAGVANNEDGLGAGILHKAGPAWPPRVSAPPRLTSRQTALMDPAGTAAAPTTAWPSPSLGCNPCTRWQRPPGIWSNPKQQPRSAVAVVGTPASSMHGASTILKNSLWLNRRNPDCFNPFQGHGSVALSTFTCGGAIPTIHPQTCAGSQMETLSPAITRSPPHPQPLAPSTSRV